MDPAEATLYGAIIAGVFALLGVVVGLFGERWLRRLGRVRCTIDRWRKETGNPEEPEERVLEVTFFNGKELPVAVVEMQVEFYKGGRRVGDWVRPSLRFVDEGGHRSELGPVNLPSRTAVPKKISVTAGREDIRRELAKADKAVFTAKVVGAGDKRRSLSPAWRGD